MSEDLQAAMQGEGRRDDGLGRQVTKGARWASAATVANMTMVWVTTIALARLLERSEFGLAAMAMLVVAIFSLFQGAGLHASLIQRKERMQAAIDTASAYAPLSGLALGGLCVASAPLAELFFDNGDVTNLVRALGLVFVLGSFSIVPRALLDKELLFGRKTAITVSGAALEMATVITFAALGKGAWAIVIGKIVSAGWSGSLMWVVCPFKAHPRRASFQELRSLLSYGRHIVAGNVVGFINSSTDAAVIGRFYGPASLGAYALGFQTGRRAVANVTYVTNQVVFPAYSKLQDDPERFRRAYLRSLRFISVISMPAGFGLATLSDEFVRVVYGDSWEAAIPVLAIIAFHGLFLSVSATTGEVFKAVGKPQFFFRTGLLHLFLLFGMIGALYPFGIAGFAGARAVASFAVGVVALAWASKIIGIETPIWLRTLRPSFTAAVMMAAVLFATKFGLGLVTETATPPLLIFFIAEGTALYILAMRIFASREWADFLTELETLSGFPSIRRRVRSALRGRRSVVPS